MPPKETQTQVVLLRVFDQQKQHCIKRDCKEILLILCHVITVHLNMLKIPRTVMHMHDFKGCGLVMDKRNMTVQSSSEFLERRTTSRCSRFGFVCLCTHIYTYGQKYARVRAHTHNHSASEMNKCDHIITFHSTQ